MSLARITREWEGETVAIFASGPSMCVEDAEAVRGTCRTIAINNQSFDCAPWADVIWGSDYKWWREYWARIESLPGRKLTVRQGEVHRGVDHLEISHAVFDDRPEYLSCGGNSGYAALCLAAKLGASRMLLYGFDMRKVNGRARRFDYPPDLNANGRYQHWAANFDRLAPQLKARHVSVINCTPGSALRCFPFEQQEVCCA